MRMWFPSAARALALAAGGLIAGGALAAPKGSPEAAADCLQKAAIRFSIDDAQCSTFPAGSEAFNWCKSQAVQKYASAIGACAAEAPAASVRGTDPATGRRRAAGGA